MGKGDNATAEKILGNSFAMLLGAGAVLGAAVMIWGESLLLLFGASVNTIGYSVCRRPRA